MGDWLERLQKPETCCGLLEGLLAVEAKPKLALRIASSPSDDFLRTGCLGEEQTRVDLSRFVSLPKSERLKMEADRYAAGGTARIAEVGLDPESGEWYYLTFRPDKVIPNHISTCLGSLMELAEHITTEELRYRMSVPAGARDQFRKDLRKLYSQLLAHHRKRHQQRG